MPTGHGDGLAICHLEDRSRRRQPCFFLRRSGLRAQRRVSPAPHSAQARVKHPVLLPSILTLLSPFVLLSSLFYPHSSRFHDLLEPVQIRRHSFRKGTFRSAQGPRVRLAREVFSSLREVPSDPHQ